LHKSLSSTVDERRVELQQWVAEQLGEQLGQGLPASTDASFRRYFRFSYGGNTLVAMDAPPPQEDCQPFVTVAALLAEAGVNSPDIIAQDLSRGFLLLQDLGRDTYLDVLNAGNADALFGDAIDALLRIQSISAGDSLPAYDEALLRRELELFPEWYLGRHLGRDIDARLRADLDQLSEVLVQRALAQERVFVHRDYMPRNLMLSEPNPGVIDFQDAVYGPISYDPICLFKDAFVSWPEDRVTQWLRQYWQRAGALGLPVPAGFDEFRKDCDLMGAQRHLKVMGIFARICHRDGKPAYLDDVPRFINYLVQVAPRYPELAPLQRILDSLAAAQPA
jgi:aminoglycoside/choline kinase family phosphotransferase